MCVGEDWRLVSGRNTLKQATELPLRFRLGSPPPDSQVRLPRPWPGAVGIRKGQTPTTQSVVPAQALTSSYQQCTGSTAAHVLTQNLHCNKNPQVFCVNIKFEKH